VPAGQRPSAEIDPQLVDPPVGLLVGNDSHGEIHPPGLAAEVQHHLLNAVTLGDGDADVLDRGVAFLEPRLGFGCELGRTPALP
jgi:hypothetical protein